MAEFIEREKIINGLELSIASWSRDCNSSAPIIANAYRDILSRVKNYPTADVVEVVHGEWKEIDNIVIENGMLTVKGTTWCCNVCGEARKTLTKPNMNYCPNCGADMRGERGKEK